MKNISIKPYNEIYFFGKRKTKTKVVADLLEKFVDIDGDKLDLFGVEIICFNLTVLEFFAAAIVNNTKLFRATIRCNKNDYYKNQESYNRLFFAVDEKLRGNYLGRG